MKFARYVHLLLQVACIVEVKPHDNITVSKVFHRCIVCALAIASTCIPIAAAHLAALHLGATPATGPRLVHMFLGSCLFLVLAKRDHDDFAFAPHTHASTVLCMMHYPVIPPDMLCLHLALTHAAAGLGKGMLLLASWNQKFGNAGVLISLPSRREHLCAQTGI